MFFPKICRTAQFESTLFELPVDLSQTKPQHQTVLIFLQKNSHYSRTQYNTAVFAYFPQKNLTTLFEFSSSVFKNPLYMALLTILQNSHLVIASSRCDVRVSTQIQHSISTYLDYLHVPKYVVQRHVPTQRNVTTFEGLRFRSLISVLG